MRAYLAFVKKEWMEYAKTYKLLIVFVVFLLFGMLNPITAKIVPDVLNSVMPQGVIVNLPPPGPLDSWTQFYKNMTGIQIIVFVILFGGIMAGELSRGTLIHLLTKGLPRKTVVWAKLTSVALLWTAGYALCFAATYGYTLYLLPGDVPHLFFGAFCMWLFGLLVISVLLLGSVLFANAYGPLLVTGGFAVLLMLLNLSVALQKGNPYRLASDCMGLLTGAVAPSEMLLPAAMACVGIGLAVFAAQACFDQKAL